MSSNLLVLVFPKEHQLREYVVSVLACLHDLVFKVRWQNEIDIAEQIVGFLQQFLEVFEELKGKKFYLAGESVSPPLFC